MEHQKILNCWMKQTMLNLLRKWNIFNDNSKANYNVGNEFIYNTEVFKSNLCGYNHA